MTKEENVTPRFKVMEKIMRTIMLRQLGLVSILALTLPLAASADERKDLAFQVIDRNAQQMTDISDSIYYFGELGMQEFEGSKLLKDTLEAGGFRCEGGRGWMHLAMVVVL